MPRTARILTVTAAAVTFLSIGTAAFAAPVDRSRSVGPDASGPAKFGLCTAYEASTPAHPTNLSAIAFTNLAAAAAATGKSVADFCGVTLADEGDTSGSTTTTAPPNTDL